MVPTVFISSTHDDLRPHRIAIEEAALKAGFMPSLTEYWPASSEKAPLAKCLAKVSECDVLVCVVAHRYGWIPAGQHNDEVKSISWLECEKAHREGKEVLVFILDDGVSWPDRNREEYQYTVAHIDKQATPERIHLIDTSVAMLSEFKKWLCTLGIRRTFRSVEDLRSEVLVALGDWRVRHGSDTAHQSKHVDEYPDSNEALTALMRQTKYIDIRGLFTGSGRAHRIALDTFYIPLTAVSPLTGTAHAATEGPEGHTVGDEGDLRHALKYKHLVIVGDPGSGKTTFLRRVANALAESLLNVDPQAAEKRLGIQGKVPYPIYLRLSDVSSYMERAKDAAESPITDDSPEWLIRVLERSAQERSWRLTAEFYREKLQSAACILLLDGFDEASTERMRRKISKVVAGLSTCYPQCRIILTSRPKAYTLDVALAEFYEVRIAPLTEKAIRSFLRQWCEALFNDDSRQAESHHRALERAVDARPEIRRMATNPVMLTALAVVHWNEGKLPVRRAALYESILKWLALSRETRPDRPPAERCLTLLQELALAMQDDARGRQTEVPRGAAAEAIAVYFRDSDFPLEAAKTFLLEEELDSGIIVALGHNVRFWHLSFQEFLTARAIAARADSEQQRLLLARRERLLSSEWRETVVLFAGVLFEQGLHKIDAMVGSLLKAEYTLPRSTTDKARVVGLFNAIERDLQTLKYRIRDPRYKEMLTDVLSIYDAARTQSVSMDVRLEAADALCPNGEHQLYSTEWVDINASSFLMGAQRADCHAHGYDPGALCTDIRPFNVDLKAFQISRYPTTVGEFALFVDDKGYQLADYWVAGGFGAWVRPEAWDNQLEYPNRPVVGVSWYEACAFCRWMGRGVCLPSEAQWERAARGLVGRVFPWGDDPPEPSRLNYSHSKIGRVTPIGLYPSGATPDGIFDLAGNVFEWCLDDWSDGCRQDVNAVGDDASNKPVLRVVRGGSFNDVGYVVRAALRGRFSPEVRINSVGFRTCRIIT